MQANVAMAAPNKAKNCQRRIRPGEACPWRSMGDRMAVNQPHAVMKKTAVEKKSIVENERESCKPTASIERSTAGAAIIQMNVMPTRKAKATVKMPATDAGNQRRRKTSNENKMSDGHRERAWPEAKAV